MDPTEIKSGFVPMNSIGPLISLPAAGLLSLSEPDAEGHARQEMLAGEAFFKSGQFQLALDRFLEAVRLQPNHAEYHFRVASAAKELDESRLVEKYLLQAIQLDPKSFSAHS